MTGRGRRSLGKRIAILLTLSLLTGLGLCLMMVACAVSHSAWPLLAFCVSCSALVPLLGCGLADRLTGADGGVPDYLQADASEADLDWTDVGWVVFGMLLLSGFACPLVMAQARLVTINVAWITACSAWATEAVVVSAVAFLHRGSSG